VNGIDVDFGLSFDALILIMAKRPHEIPSFYASMGHENEHVLYVFVENGKKFGYSPNDVSKVSLKIKLKGNFATVWKLN